MHRSGCAVFGLTLTIRSVLLTALIASGYLGLPYDTSNLLPAHDCDALSLQPSGRWQSVLDDGECLAEWLQHTLCRAIQKAFHRGWFPLNRQSDTATQVPPPMALAGLQCGIRCSLCGSRSVVMNLSSFTPSSHCCHRSYGCSASMVRPTGLHRALA